MFRLVEKHHVFLSEDLLFMDYASSPLDPEGAWQACVRAVEKVETTWAVAATRPP
jgi:hypothetical protein